MRALAATLACALLAVLVSGCLAPGPGPEPQVGQPPPPSSASGALTARPDPALGMISGRVLTTALVPIEDATVHVSRSGETVVRTTTDEEGTFVLRGLFPGEYVVQFTAACCSSLARTVVVPVGGMAEVSAALGPAAPESEPYVVEEVWNGLIGCGFVVLVVGQCPDMNEDHARGFEVKAGASTILAAMVWEESPTNLGGTLRLWLETEEAVLADEGGVSPVQLRHDAGPGDAAGLENVTDTPLPLRMRVWPGGEVNLAYQQPFTVYYHIHYDGHAPVGASALPD